MAKKCVSIYGIIGRVGWGVLGHFSENLMSWGDQFSFNTDFQWIAPLGHSAWYPNVYHALLEGNPQFYKI